jgi:CheY-like chemotaxis protein
MARKKILIADDSRTSLMMNTMILGHGGSYDIISARDGQEAVEKALSERPDLILLDVLMPRLTGLDACRVLRSRRETESIPILLLTTQGEEENVARGYEAGCTEYVTKPVSASDLLAKVHLFLGE